MSKNKYRRSLAAARKLIEARTTALQGFADHSGLAEHLYRLTLDDLPEEDHRHSKGYVGAILEFAAQHSQGHGCCGDDLDHSPETHNDPRKFANHFLSKRPEYSRTKNGLSASMFEAWLMESSGYLFSRFVETVLEKGTKFVAVFEGKLNKEELRRMRTGTAPFMQFDILIEAGQHNGEEIFEFTIFDCTAVKGKKDDAPDVQTNMPPVGSKTDDVKLSGVQGGGRFESLLPDTRDQYDAVYEEGGVDREALAIVLGDDALDTLVEGPQGSRVVDANGVVWLSEDGAAWLPDVSSLVEDGKVSQEPRNYRPYGDEFSHGSCSGCRFVRFDDEGSGRECELFEYAVQAHMTCDAWAARQEGLPESAAPSMVIVSDFGTWTVQDSGTSTLVAVDESACLLPQSFDEVREAIEEVGRLYGDDLDAERDLVVEAMLRDIAEDCGTLVDNPRRLAEDQRAERDTRVNTNNATRLEEAELLSTLPRFAVTFVPRIGLEETKRCWERAGEQMCEAYPDASVDSEHWHQLKAGLFKSLVRISEEDDAEDKGKKQ